LARIVAALAVLIVIRANRHDIMTVEFRRPSGAVRRPLDAEAVASMLAVLASRLAACRQIAQFLAFQHQ
jgi:hypothetical protein